MAQRSSQRDDHAPALVPALDVTVGLGDPCARVHAIDDGLDGARFDPSLTTTPLRDTPGRPHATAEHATAGYLRRIGDPGASTI
jgi:hypothetical protein